MIIINIIFDPNRHNIKITNNESKVQLSNLKFFMPKSFLFDTFAIIRKVGQNDKNLIKLSLSSEESRNFNIFKASADNIITAPEGDSEITLLYLNNKELMTTNSLPINIGYENFEQGQKILLLKELSEEIALAYDRIQKMTELNIQLYKDIREVAKE